MQPITTQMADVLMSEALKEAERAAAAGEVPVGAVIAVEGSIIARAHNRTESDHFVGSHAEMIAIQQFSQQQKNWRLSDAVLCVTLEPCTMCFGAIRLARIPTLIFGAGDSKQGAVGSLYDLSLDSRLGASMKIIRNHRAEECGGILRAFFDLKR